MDPVVKACAAARSLANTYQPAVVPLIDTVERYALTGDPAQRAALQPTGASSFYFGPLAKAFGHPARWREEERRLLEACARLECYDVVGEWLDDLLAREADGEDLWGAAAEVLATAGATADRMREVAGAHITRLSRAGRPTSVGRFVLGLRDDELRQYTDRFGGTMMAGTLLALFAQEAPHRLGAVARVLIGKQTPPHKCEGIAVHVVQYAGDEGEQAVLDACSTLKGESLFRTALPLMRKKPEQYTELALRGARAEVDGAKDGEYYPHPDICAWLAVHGGAAEYPRIIRYLQMPAPDWHPSQRELLDQCMQALGEAALPLAYAGLQGGNTKVRLGALGHLITLGGDDAVPTILETFRTWVPQGDTETLVATLNLVARWREVHRLADDLWPLMQHKSKPVRGATARALGGGSDEVLAKAEPLLQAKKADIRVAAIVLLSTLGTPAAQSLLEARLEHEEDDELREAILEALPEREVTRAEVEAAIARSAGRVKWPPAAWLEGATLPPLYYVDGGELPEAAVRYLLARQACIGEMRPSRELAPLFALIDRARSGDFALAVLQGFLASPCDAKDRWALTVAGLLGDDRVVPALSAQIARWVDASRGKLAEYAVQALALMGTDAALMQVDSLALKYRTKMKNVGAAAVEAFNAAAIARGMSPEELGDRVVPWLGFAPGERRIIDCGAKRVEVRVGVDLKLAFVDVEKGKRVGSLSSGASAEDKAAMKDLAVLLRDVAKAQTRRMEGLMVRQHRWPVARWQALFLAHPVLVPFGVRLVWGSYAADGGLLATFRALEDGTLTDAHDEAVVLPTDARIGIVHPLELPDEMREAWMTHLADYEIEPPFPQLTRPVVAVEPAEAGATRYAGVENTSINAMTFKGRAERLGWRRGSVCDAGGITAYLKDFPAGGADAFLLLDGMYIGIDMYSDINLGKLFFARHGSVEVGSYTYDEPTDDTDPRLIPLGQVPPIVYSEVMSDLRKISGARDQEEE